MEVRCDDIPLQLYKLSQLMRIDFTGELRELKLSHILTKCSDKMQRIGCYHASREEQARLARVRAALLLAAVDQSQRSSRDQLTGGQTVHCSSVSVVAGLSSRELGERSQACLAGDRLRLSGPTRPSLDHDERLRTLPGRLPAPRHQVERGVQQTVGHTATADGRGAGKTKNVLRCHRDDTSREKQYSD